MLLGSQSDVLHHESEVQVLREALDQQNLELATSARRTSSPRQRCASLCTVLSSISSNTAVDRVVLLGRACEIKR